VRCTGIDSLSLSNEPSVRLDYVRFKTEFSLIEASMKDISVTQSIVPLGKFKARAPYYLLEVKSSGRPMVITQNGHAAAVLLSPEEFDRIREHVRLLESIATGLSDAAAGSVMDTETLKVRLADLRAGRELPE
jgi:prevent-host-death family protein